MNRTRAYRLYVSMALMALTQYVLQYSGIHVPLVHAYLDDLLCMPLLLFPILLLFRRFIGPHYVFPPFYPILTWVALCMVFEVLVPIYHPGFTGDGWDMLFYGIGGVIFWLMQRAFAPVAELGKV